MQRPKKILLLIVTLFSALIVLFFFAAWGACYATGKTPGEIMDYMEVRLRGHSKFEWLALPVLANIRSVLNQPSRQDSLNRPFAIPIPPPLILKKNASNLKTLYPESNGRVLRVGLGEEFNTISHAAKMAKDGDVVEIQAGEYHGDVALWNQKKLTIRTRGGSARLYSDGKSAEGKAIWVIRNGDFDIENIDFIGTRVSDHNGAGIRFERGKLRIKNCLFFDNDTGLLASNSGELLEVVNSEFSYNGFGDGFSHNIYVNKIDTLKITNSYFHHVNVGHLIKSRARHNYIYYNRITDESGGRASYEIDLSNGGIAYIVGNIIQQDASAQNSTLISYGVEGLAWPENKLYLASNTIVNDGAYGGTFVHTAPATQTFVSMNNLIIGKGRIHRGTVSVESTNDIRSDWELFKQASRHNYSLNDKGQSLDFVLPTDTQLVPQSEYTSTRTTHKLISPPRFPGAIQMQ